MAWLQSAWEKLNRETVGSGVYWHIALQNASVYYDTLPLIRRHVHGRILDVGAGRLAWRNIIRRRGSSYISADLTRESKDLDLLFDATSPYPLRADTFDTVFCYAVLEHTREPWQAFPQIFRVLKPGGKAIIAVPFFFYLHGQPHDYFRFTPHSLRYMAEQNGFEVLELVANGGMLTTLLNFPSMLISSLLAALGLVRLVPPITMGWLKLARLFGRLEGGGLFAMNHIMVIQKPCAAKARIDEPV